MPVVIYEVFSHRSLSKYILGLKTTIIDLSTMLPKLDSRDARSNKTGLGI